MGRFVCKRLIFSFIKRAILASGADGDDAKLASKEKDENVFQKFRNNFRFPETISKICCQTETFSVVSFVIVIGDQKVKQAPLLLPN